MPLNSHPKDNWGRTEIGSLCDQGGGDVQTGPFGSQLHAKDYVERGVPVVMPADILDNRITTSSIACIGDEDWTRLSRYHLEEGDIVFSRRGDLGRIALIGERENGWLCGTGCLRVRFGSAPINPRFAFYHLSEKATENYLMAKAVGTTMPNLNTDILRSVPMVLPPLPEQRRIATVLGALDDKIALNRRMNRTLEAMAQTLFRHRFVDLAGRDDLVDSGTDLGATPAGWTVGKISDLAELNPVSWSKKTAPDQIHYLTLSDVDWGDYSKPEKMSYSESPSRARRILEEHDTIFGRVRPGNGSYALVQRPEFNLTGSTGFTVLRPRHPEARYFVYLWTTQSESVELFASLADGSAYPAVGHKQIYHHKALLPSREALQEFDALVHPLFERRAANRQENHTLAALRDTLLPKLISGEIRVPEAEEFITDAQ